MSIVLQVLQSHVAIAFIYPSLYALLEYWLGKTKVVPFGSVLEGFLMLLKKIFKPSDVA